MPAPAGLRRTLGLRDLILFYVATTFSVRWVATAAAAGPSAVVVWLIAAAAFFVPLALAVLELASRYPEEGGVYAWARRAFGGFAGFLTGWSYWASNLPYIPSLLYFAAANALYIGKGVDGGGGAGRWQHLANDRGYFLAVSVAGLALAVAANLIGLERGKWLIHVGALGQWIPGLLVVGLGLAAWLRFGSATSFTPATLAPRAGLGEVIFWSTIAFAFGGVESGSNLGDEIRDARRTVPRAVLLGGAAIASVYVLGTVCLLLALPAGEVSGLQGILQAIARAAGRVGIPGITPAAALLVTAGALGSAAAWFAATARLPFVAGLDRYLPAAFARVHPRLGVPHVALLVQGAVALVFVVLGQAGTTVQGAYEALVSMGIITYFIPFLFLFAAAIRLGREPAGPEVVRAPGGRAVSVASACVGFATTAASIVFACIPPADSPNRGLAAAKIVGLSALSVAIGAGLYWLGRRRSTGNEA
jgi:glutamate:GABA antiporter